MRTYAEVCMDYAKDALKCGHLSGPETADMRIIQTLANRLHKAIGNLNRSQQPTDWDLAVELEKIPGKDETDEQPECGAW